MTGEMIVSFRKDVQQAIALNPEKFNPNGDDRIDEQEIGVLLSEFGANSKKDLLNSRVKFSDFGYNFIERCDGSPAPFAASGATSLTMLVVAGNAATKNMRRTCGVVSLLTGLFSLVPFVAEWIDPRK
jgi:hypothetical protein